jgi:hypothetical protein
MIFAKARASLKLLYVRASRKKKKCDRNILFLLTALNGRKEGLGLEEKGLG